MLKAQVVFKRKMATTHIFFFARVPFVCHPQKIEEIFRQFLTIQWLCSIGPHACLETILHNSCQKHNDPIKIVWAFERRGYFLIFERYDGRWSSMLWTDVLWLCSGFLCECEIIPWNWGCTRSISNWQNVLIFPFI
jgi:hypothetical protein